MIFNSMVFVALSIGTSFLYVQPSRTSVTPHVIVKDEKAFNGQWWLGADIEERSGFMEGAADCLTWTAHREGFSATPNQLSPKITQYYQTHSSERKQLVTEVWKKLQPEPSASTHAPDGESWKNAHWYLNGLWWRQSSETEQLGFLEGYRWCMRSCVKSKSQSYSHPDGYYVAKITEFLKAHPKGDDESVASILLRYRDK